jgi:hypothetical protein
VHLRQPPGEVLCARLPIAVFTQRRKVFVFTDKRRRVASAQGLARVLLAPKRAGGARLVAGGRCVTLAGLAAGPYCLTLGLHQGGRTTRRRAATDRTLGSTKHGALRYP